MAGIVIRETSLATPMCIKASSLVLVERPNKVELEEQVNRIYEKVDALRKRIADINATLSRRNRILGEISHQLMSSRNRQNELNASFRSLEEDRKDLHADLHLVDQVRNQRKVSARALQDGLPFVTVERLDEEVKSIEYKMHHTSLTLHEEKRLLQQIKDLRKSRVFVQEYTNQIFHIRKGEDLREGLLQRIKDSNTMLAEVNTQREDQRKVLAEIKATKAMEKGEITAVYIERDAFVNKMWSLKEQARLIKAQFKAKENEFHKKRRDIKHQKNASHNEAFQEREAERRERDDFKKQEAWENSVKPFSNEILTCNQLRSYLQKYVTTSRKETPELSINQQQNFIAPLGVGDLLISKKTRGDNELIGWYAGARTKDCAKKERSHALQKNKGKSTMTHSADVLQAFFVAKLSAPTSLEDVPQSLEEVNLALENFQGLQKEVLSLAVEP